MIAHGVSLRRADITGEEDLQELVDARGKVIDMDLDDLYARNIKDIYSANIEFLSRAQAAAPRDYAEAYNNRGFASHVSGDLKGAEEDLSRALEATPQGSPQRAEIEKLYRQVREELGQA